MEGSYCHSKTPRNSMSKPSAKRNTVELQWLENLWNHEIMFETVVVRANECESLRQVRMHNRDKFSIFFNIKVCFVF